MGDNIHATYAELFACFMGSIFFQLQKRGSYGQEGRIPPSWDKMLIHPPANRGAKSPRM